MSNRPITDQELNRAIYHVSLTPDGAILIDHLKEQYGEVSLRGSTTNGIDPYAMAANVGAHDVYIDIKERIEDGNLAR